MSKIIGIQEPLGYNRVVLYPGEDNEKSTQPYANHPRNDTCQASCKEKKRIPDPTEAIPITGERRLTQWTYAKLRG